MPSDPICVDILVRWGDQTLQTARLKPPRTFRLGEESCDAFVPGEYLSDNCMPLVLQGPGAMLRAVVPPCAQARIELPGGSVLSCKQAARAGILQPCPEVPGARQVWLHPGVRAAIRLRRRSEVAGPYRGDGKDDSALVIVVECVEAMPFPRALLKRPPWPFWISAAAALSLHTSLFLWIAFAMPSMLADDRWEADPGQPLSLYSPYVTLAQPEEPDDAVPPASELPGGPAEDASLCGEPGPLGRPDGARSQDRFGLQGPADNPDPHLARLHGDMWWSGIGWGPEGWGTWKHNHVAPWGRDDALGKDAVSARGRLAAKSIGDARGTTGVSQWGRGGGGFSLDVRRQDACQAQSSTGSALHFGVPTASRPEVAAAIRRVAQANAGRMAHCFAGRSLRGRVTVQATVGADGQVESVSDGGSELASRDVVQCIVQAFGTLQFPNATTAPVEITVPMVIAAGS